MWQAKRITQQKHNDRLKNGPDKLDPRTHPLILTGRSETTEIQAHWGKGTWTALTVFQRNADKTDDTLCGALGVQRHIPPLITTLLPFSTLALKLRQRTCHQARSPQASIPFFHTCYLIFNCSSEPLNVFLF